MLTLEELAPLVDHTNLNPNIAEEAIAQLANEAKECHFGAVCVRYNVAEKIRPLLESTGISIVSTVGFPTKKYTTHKEMLAEQSQYDRARRCQEAIIATEGGAADIDMVLDHKAFLRGDYNMVKKDIASVVDAADGVPVKVILENCFLNAPQIQRACELSEAAGASYVKTSTGFGPGGAKLADITLMARSVSVHIGIKPAGGVKNLQVASEFYDAIVPHKVRFGASGLVALYCGGSQNSGY